MPITTLPENLCSPSLRPTDAECHWKRTLFSGDFDFSVQLQNRSDCPAPGLFRWFYAHLPIRRFMPVTMTLTPDHGITNPILRLSDAIVKPCRKSDLVRRMFERLPRIVFFFAAKRKRGMADFASEEGQNCHNCQLPCQWKACVLDSRAPFCVAGKYKTDCTQRHDNTNPIKHGCEPCTAVRSLHGILMLFT